MPDTDPLIAAEPCRLRSPMSHPSPGHWARRPSVLLDVRWTLAGSDRDAYLEAHLPGAVFVDLDHELAAPPGTGGRHPLPDPADCRRVWRAAGIGDGPPSSPTTAGTGWPPPVRGGCCAGRGCATCGCSTAASPAWAAGPSRPVEEGDGNPRRRDVTVVPGGMPVVEVEGGGGLAASAAACWSTPERPSDSAARSSRWTRSQAHPGAVNLPLTGLWPGRHVPAGASEIAGAFASVGSEAPTTCGRPTVAAASCGSGRDGLPADPGRRTRRYPAGAVPGFILAVVRPGPSGGGRRLRVAGTGDRMRAIQIQQFGGPEVLQVRELPDVAPAPARGRARGRGGRRQSRGRPGPYRPLSPRRAAPADSRVSRARAPCLRSGRDVVDIAVGQRVVAMGETNAPGFYADRAVVADGR